MLNAELKRVIPDVGAVAAILSLYWFGLYTYLPAPLQLVALKALLVSAGLLSAHISGKLIFPKVNWSAVSLTAGHYARIALYVICVYAYSLGG